MTKKYCDDCKYIYGYVCNHKKSEVIDDGLIFKTSSHNTCYHMRKNIELCGKTAVLFEPSILYRIKRIFKWKKS